MRAGFFVSVAVMLAILISVIVFALTVLGLSSNWTDGSLGWALSLVNHFHLQALWLSVAALCLCGSGLFLLKVPHKTVKWAAGLAGMAFLINLAMVGPYYLPVLQPASPPDTKFRLYLFNMGSISDPQPLLENIHEQKPDVICITELSPEFDEAMRKDRQAYPYGFSSSQLGIYSRFPLSAQKIVTIKPLVGTYLSAYLKLEGHTEHLVLGHPVVPLTPAALDRQRQYFNQWREDFHTERHGLVLTGDFNSTPWAEHLQRLLRESNLQDSQSGSGIQGSWPSQEPLIRIPIDHILTTPDFMVLNRHIGKDLGSDHLPVIIDLGLKEPVRR